MRTRQGRHQFLPPQRLGGQRRVAHRQQHQPGVERVGFQSRFLLLGGQLAQLDADVREALAKDSHHLRQPAEGQPGDEAQPQSPDLARRRPPGPLDHLIGLFERGTRRRQKLAPSRGQMHLAGGPAHERHADLLLQVLDRVRECLLHHEDPLGGAAKVLFFRQGDEVAKVAEFHVRLLREVKQMMWVRGQRFRSPYC